MISMTEGEREQKRRISTWMVSTIVLIIALAGVVLFGGPITGMAVSGSISPQEAADKAISYLNENLISEGTASFVSVEELGGIYNVTFSYQDREGLLYVTNDGKYMILFGLGIFDITKALPLPPEPPEETIGDFLIGEEEICKEDGKPIIYIFGRTTCPHCSWLHPIITSVAESFEGYVSLHDNTDLEADMDVYSRFGSGYIPLTIIGCKYYRTGTAHEPENDTETEANEITALICSLTGNKPLSVCAAVENLIDQIE